MQETKIICPLCETPNDGGKFCAVCGGKLDTGDFAPEDTAPAIQAAMVDPEELDEYVETIAPMEEKKAKRSVAGIVITAIIAALLLGAVGYLVYDDLSLRNQLTLYKNSNAKLEQTVKAQDQELADLEDQTKADAKSIEELTAQLEDAQALSKYKTIFDHIVEKDAEGVAADPYFVSDSLLIMKKGDTKKLTLYADWDKQAKANLECSSKAATIHFSDSEWSGETTKLTVTAVEEGVCVATFTNSADKGTFQVLIIVTE